jgi:tetratricopeptide (TPR) repeat protein
MVIFAILAILALTSPCPAQSETPAQIDEHELWLVRSQNITNDVLKDAGDLSSRQRAVLYAKLAQRWWRVDARRATTWIVNAIEAVEQVPNKETTAERKERLEAARVLLAIVTPLDQKFTKRLLTVLTDKSTGNGHFEVADALIDAALAIVKDDPKRAAELGALALRTDAPNNLDSLLIPLRRSEPKLADSLFMQALALVKQNPRGMLSNSLMYVAFPVQRGLSGDIPVPPDLLRIELLQFYVTLITNSMAESGDQNLTCGTVSWLAPLFSEIERLIPKQMPVVRQAINRCQSTAPLAQQLIDDATRSQPLDTVESLLKAALDAKDPQVSTVYTFRAASLAAQRKDYELAIKILEDMPKEAREFMNESWTSWRWNWASDGAVEHYKNGRFREMNLILDATPQDLQPFAKAAFVTWLPEQAVSETAPVIQVLNDAIKGLRRSNITASDKYNWYFGLLGATVKYQPDDANAVLKDAIASLNQIKEAAPLNQTDWLRYLGAPLLEMDEFVVKDALASITPVPYRAQLRLALLDATLERLNTSAR